MWLALLDGFSVPGRESPGNPHPAEIGVGRVGAPCRGAGWDPTRRALVTGLMSLQTAKAGACPMLEPQWPPLPCRVGKSQVTCLPVHTEPQVATNSGPLPIYR